MASLIDAMPEEFARYHTHERAHRYADVEVVKEHSYSHDAFLEDCGMTEPYVSWPGPQKHVYYWVELANGYAVGWNENPGRGWSFPVVKMK